MKVIAMYLPQYHSIPENDKWWGKGYTEWTAVKNAVPYFKNHYQPRVPLNSNYYDLSDESAKTWKQQAKWANEYGVDAFCVYHYWFRTGKQLLEKPIEVLRKHTEIDINYCFCWANETWTRTWYGVKEDVLCLQEYLDENEWRNHYLYLANYFSDSRYLKHDGAPIICIYRAQDIPCLDEMVAKWNDWAKEDGYKGVYVIAGNTASGVDEREIINAWYDFEPGLTIARGLPKSMRLTINLKAKLNIVYNNFFKTKRIERIIDTRKIYEYMGSSNSMDKKDRYPGIFPMWDNTPRRKYKGTCYINSSPELFGKRLQKLMGEEKTEYIFINAWNEWGEGCYLEPDEKYHFQYLEQIRKARNEKENH